MLCIQLLAGTGQMGLLTSEFCSPSPTPSGLLSAPLTVHMLDARVPLPISIIYMLQTHRSITKTYTCRYTLVGFWGLNFKRCFDAHMISSRERDVPAFHSDQNRH